MKKQKNQMKGHQTTKIIAYDNGWLSTLTQQLQFRELKCVKWNSGDTKVLMEMLTLMNKKSKRVQTCETNVGKHK